MGVEFALAGHASLLTREGLLVEDERLQTRRAPPLGTTWQGLIIDDFFVISSQPVEVPAEKSSAFLHLARARAAYERHSLGRLKRMWWLLEPLRQLVQSVIHRQTSLRLACAWLVLHFRKGLVWGSLV